MSTGGLTALRKLTKHLKLLKEACFTGDTKVLTEAQKLIQIKTERAEIKVTPSHPMLKIGNTWVFAGVLKVGDKLAGYDGEEVEITEIEEELLESPEKVYNLTIEDFHTYVVSEESVIVHNKCDLPSLKGTGDVWSTIKATQPVYRGTVIPRSFEITLANGKMWVHGNGTKHIYEEVAKQMKSTGINPKYYSQLLMDDFSGALSKATKNGVKYDELISVGNWEFKFSIPREEGLLPVIKHAQFNGWGN